MCAKTSGCNISVRVSHIHTPCVYTSHIYAYHVQMHDTYVYPNPLGPSETSGTLGPSAVLGEFHVTLVSEVVVGKKRARSTYRDPAPTC